MLYAIIYTITSPQGKDMLPFILPLPLPSLSGITVSHYYLLPLSH